MVIVGRLSAVWQVAGVAGAALCCYLVSQSVAAERAGLAKVDRQIAQQQDAIAKLDMEIATRSRLTQVESWNRQLALQAPRPGQYMQDGLQLASLYAHGPKPQLNLNPAIVTQQGPLERTAYAAPAPASASASAPRIALVTPHLSSSVRAGLVVLRATSAAPATRPSTSLGANEAGGRNGLVLASIARPAPVQPAATASRSFSVRAAPVEARASRAAPAARPSTSLGTNGMGGRSGLVLASLTRPAAAQPDAAQSAPALRTANLVRPKPSRLAGDDDAPAVKHAAFHPEAVASLLSSDIASLARAEQARKRKSGE